MNDYATAVRKGVRWMESGSGASHLGRLAEYLSDELRQPWAATNIDKLNRIDAQERHLFLIGRTVLIRGYYARLSDTYQAGPIERIAGLVLPEGISDIWFSGRGARGATNLHPSTQWVARYNRLAGWSRHAVTIDEQLLPEPAIGRAPTHKTSSRPV